MLNLSLAPLPNESPKNRRPGGRKAIKARHIFEDCSYARDSLDLAVSENRKEHNMAGLHRPPGPPEPSKLRSRPHVQWLSGQPDDTYTDHRRRPCRQARPALIWSIDRPVPGRRALVMGSSRSISTPDWPRLCEEGG